MPGILPMKVIKVGTTAQSRIAQACDRCRSKKIRCDGITPCCSQCANVGFECKTSDKLSRRAFPRGYTESLEERVRNLEGEVKEMKDLLDAKDEKIDMLSRIHSNSPSLRRRSSTLSSSADAASRTNSVDKQNKEEDISGLQQSPTINGDGTPSLHLAGASCGRLFVDAFKAKIKETGKQVPNFKTEVFFQQEKQDDPTLRADALSLSSKMPSRMASDQMINIFFQEWASLFPVLHRPTILEIYSEFVADPKDVKDQHAIAQLYLIYGIAALSAEWNKHDALTFEPQWQSALEAISEEYTVPTLQCLVLAQLHCIAKKDYEALEKYKAAAVIVSRRLGLHHKQKRSSMGPLTIETRKKVFWTLYTVDCFSAALLGQPRSLVEEDIKCEYPQDVDDENVTEEGFRPALPGESTRISSALALFRGASILSGILDEIYPASGSRRLSMQTIAALSEELDIWQAGLPPHLHLHFDQDKPSTNVVGSRSPFLSLAYHYIRTLIHRPLASTSASSRSSTSVVALAQSSKHIVQIIQLLEERRMSFSFCLNKNHILIMAGFGLLFQTLDLDRKGKLIQDSQRVLCSVMSTLERDGASGATEFKKVACAMISVDRFTNNTRSLIEDATRRPKPDPTMPAPKYTSKSPRKFQASVSRKLSAFRPPVKKELNGRRSTAPAFSTPLLPANLREDSGGSVRSIASEPLLNCERAKQMNVKQPPGPFEPLNLPNLDYLDFSNEPVSTSKETSSTITQSPTDDSEATSDSIDANKEATLDTTFPSPDVFSYISESPSNTLDWCSDLWAMPSDMNCQPQTSQSSLSFSEGLTSREEFGSCGASGQVNTGMIIKDNELVALDGLDAGFGL